jgi:hypothetical protein
MTPTLDAAGRQDSVPFRAMRWTIATGLLALAITFWVVGSATAQPAGGIVFEGTHAAGGIVRFTVEPNTSQIVALELDGIAGGGCSWATIDLGNWGGPIQIEANTFRATNDDGDTFVGEFLDHGRVEGTVEVTDAVKGCSSTPLAWVANFKQRF